MPNRLRFYAMAVVFVVAVVASFASASFAFADDKERETEKIQSSAVEEESKEEESDKDKPVDINDLGDDNFVNVQQTPDNSFLYDIPIADLCSADTSYQKTVVQVKGEVVGDPIKAEQNSGKFWITLDAAPDEKEGSLSVLIDESSLDAIDQYGGYNVRGTIVRVKGIFHIACTSHEGIIDIHADTLTAVDPGVEMEDDFDINNFYPGLFLCALGLFLALGYRVLAEGER